MCGGEEFGPFRNLLQGRLPPPHSHRCAAAPSPLLPAPQTRAGQRWDELGNAISASALTGLPGGPGRDTPPPPRGRILPWCPSTPALGLGAASPIPSRGDPHQWEPVNFWRDPGRPREPVGNSRAGAVGHRQSGRSGEGITTRPRTFPHPFLAPTGVPSPMGTSTAHPWRGTP